MEVTDIRDTVDARNDIAVNDSHIISDSSSVLPSAEAIDMKPVDAAGKMEESKSSSLLVNVSHAKSQSPTAVQQTQDTSMWPSLRGKLGIENGTSVCRGQWGMNDAAHNIPGQTSGFEFSLVKPEGDPSSFPVDGKYAGWFMIKQTPKSSLKVEDKDLNIKFVKDEKEDAYKITGNGVNKFGAFNLAGSLQMADNSIHMFRIYTPKKLPVGTTPRTGATQRTGSRPIPAAVPPSPRESSSRVRRPSIVLQEAVDGGLPASLDKKHADKKHADKKPTPAVAVPVAPKQRLSSETVTAGRTPRPPAFVAKCREITRELSKQHLSIYFNEPVDTVKLGIPDYRDIVKEPMDFGTVAKNLESGLYSSHEEFAEHMRLVFKNAITYNVRRDNPVHIAAREMSDMFEERYRVMVSQLGAYAATAEMDMGLLRGAPKKGKGASAGRAGRGGGRLSSGGPRVDGGVPALDSSMQTMLMMQQKMQQMEAEINSLRTAVRQSDIRATLGQQAVAAQAPLSYEEKKVLISNIMKLDGEQMTGVVDIIQSAMPSAACGDGDEVEIPVDELDTYTLRTLQEYVQSQLASKAKKRPPAASPAPRDRAPPKRQRTASTSSTGPREAPRLQPQHSAPAISSVHMPAEPPAELPDESEYSFDVDLPPAQQINRPINGDEPPISNGRLRSNSLDLFPADEPGGVTEEKEGVSAAADWKRAVPPDDGPSGNSGGWGDAVAEKHAEISRQTSNEAKERYVKDQKELLESQRIERAQLHQTARSSATLEESAAAHLERLREEEKANREGMASTVALDQAQFALYDHDAFDL